MGAAAVIAALFGFLYYQGRRERQEDESYSDPTPSGNGGGSGPVVPPDWSDPELPPGPGPAPQPAPQPEPGPAPQPQPQPQPSPLAAKVDSGLAWAQEGHPDIQPPAQLVYTDRQIGLDANGYSWGIDIYADAGNGYIGVVYVVSNTDESSVWSHRAANIPATRDKLEYYAGVLKGAV